MIRLKSAQFICTVSVFCMILMGCGGQSSPDDAVAGGDESPAKPNVEVLAGALLTAKTDAQATTALADHPDMARGTAYDIQLSALGSETAGDDYLVGWKMGGTRMTDPAATPDPSFAYILRSDSFPDAASVQAAHYVDGDVLVEAEIAFIIGQDLEGTSHTMEAVLGAVAEVAGAIELIDLRAVPGEDGVALGNNQMIAANLSHAGLILTNERHPVEAIDLVAEVATAYVGEEAVASGAGSQIMNTSAIDALYWIANALPKHGHHLRAGDVVITGSLYDNPTLTAGGTVRVEFTSFGAISVSME